ncbi:hypothetical protein ACFXOQ_37035, partial [Streptomyces californicus]
MRIRGVLAGVFVTALVSATLFAAPAQSAPTTTCEATSARDLERAEPEAVGLDSAKLTEALQFAATRNRLNV